MSPSTRFTNTVTTFHHGMRLTDTNAQEIADWVGPNYARIADDGTLQVTVSGGGLYWEQVHIGEWVFGYNGSDGNDWCYIVADDWLDGRYQRCEEQSGLHPSDG